MFAELDKAKVSLTERLYLRYDIGAFIKAELAGIDVFGGKVSPALVAYGLGACLEELDITDESQQKEVLSAMIDACGTVTLKQAVADAIALAMPLPIVGSAGKAGGEPDMRQIRFYFCDIMGKSEAEFLKCTIREVLDRWDRYAVFNGYKKAPVPFSYYDDD